jgi:hypothetical protein
MIHRIYLLSDKKHIEGLKETTGDIQKSWEHKW